MTTIGDMVANNGTINPGLNSLFATLAGGYSSPEMLQNALGGGDASLQGSGLQMLQQLANEGAVGFNDQGQWSVDSAKLNAMLPQTSYGQGAYLTNAAQGITDTGGLQHGNAPTFSGVQGHLATDANGRQYINTGSYPGANVRVGNPYNFVSDPTYGLITQNSNIRIQPKTNFLDQLASTIGPALIGAGLGSGFGALAFPSLPAGLGQIFNASVGNLESGKFNPFSFLPGVGVAAGLPSWLAPLLTLGRLAQIGKGG